MKKYLTQVVRLVCLVVMVVTFPLQVFSQEVRIQDDLYQHVNKIWLEHAELTPEIPIVDNVTDIHDILSEQLHNDLFKMIIGELAAPNKSLEQFVTFYHIVSDFQRREQEDATPIKPYLQEIESIKSIADLKAYAVDFHFYGMPFPFSFSVEPDLKNSQIHALYLSEPALVSIPKDYYEQPEVYDNLIIIYKASRIRLLELIGYNKELATDLVNQALAFDEILRPYILTKVEEADISNRYFPRTMEEVGTYSEQFDFKQISTALLDESIDHLVVTNEKYFQNFDQIVTEANLELIKSWMIVNFVQENSKYLTNDIRLAEEVYSNALIGVTESFLQEDAAYQLAIDLFKEPIGIYYGQTYFGQEAKAEVEKMTHHIIEAYKSRLSQNTWLSEATKKAAVRKLDTMKVMIGYPDYESIPFEEGIIVAEDSLFDNMMRIVQLSQYYNFASLNEPVDKESWGMGAHEVNAYYSPTSNSIVFPAAFLQAPNYSSNQTISENYGAIGATIGHEITHAFDPSGAKFDEYGNLNNWWTPEDFSAFESKTKAMVEQWNDLTYADVPINGQLTLTENVADAGGLIIALEALQKQVGDKANLEEFFISWARTWREKGTPEYYRNLIATDEHPPSELRANIHAKNLAQFHETFQTKEGDGMYLAPEKRITIW